MDSQVDWLAAILVSWTIPLEFFGNTSTYFKSLFFWLVPVVLLFLGGMAIMLVYLWADEYWMKRYNVRQRRWNQEIFGDDFRLIRISLPSIAVGIVLFAAAIFIKAYLGHGAWPPPYYATFLIAAALVPAIFAFESMSKLVNWRAFSFTCLYVLVTSCIWEVTLGIARSWWWYKRPPGVMGWYIPAFGRAARDYPMEALIVWLVVTFDTVFAYEFAKGVLHDKRSVRATLFGDQTRSNPSNAVATASPNTM